MSALPFPIGSLGLTLSLAAMPEQASSAQVIDGKAIAAEIREELKAKVTKLKQETGKVSSGHSRDARKEGMHRLKVSNVSGRGIEWSAVANDETQH